MSEPEYSEDQIVSGIESALRKHDVHAIPGLIALLALQNPRRAETILFGLRIAAKENN
jgi:hypothetical protein